MSRLKYYKPIRIMNFHRRSKPSASGKQETNYLAFKNYSDAIKSIVIAFSILFAGGWAYFEFSALLKTESAQADLNLQKAKERDILAKFQTPLKISMSYEEITTSDKKRFLSISVIISNPGSSGTTLNISDQPLRFSRVIDFNKDGSANMGSINSVGKIKLRGNVEKKDGRGPTAQVSHVILLPKQEKTIPFLIEIIESGVYLVEFRARIDEKSIEKWIENGAPEKLTKNWSVSRYINIEI